MAVDEAGTLARFNTLRAELIDPKRAQFKGRVVGSAGDSLLAEFASAVDAVQCAVENQERTASFNAGQPEDRRIAFRMSFRRRVSFGFGRGQAAEARDIGERRGKPASNEGVINA